MIDDPDFRAEFHILIDARQMEYRPTTMELFSARNAFRAMKKFFQGGITIVVAKKFLATAELLSILANAWGIRMDVVTNLDQQTNGSQDP